MNYDCDYLIVGSGFGGSVSALRLSEKGYRVLVVEKGKRWDPLQFPKTNWNLRRWLWLPLFRFHGIFKMTFMRHVGILSGVGVGGGSLVYANTLPRPEEPFFQSGSWAGLADWKKELNDHYSEAEKMLGVCENPELYDADKVLKAVAQNYGRNGLFEPTRVGVFFGEPEQVVPDPYFEGAGPERSGCTSCGGCMTGCRHNAKNSLDKNYLFLAEKKGAEIRAGKKVVRITALNGKSGQEGYQVTLRDSTRLFRRTTRVKSQGVILAGGVLGTVRLLLNMKGRYLAGISEMVGNQIRTNNESLVLVHSSQKERDFSRGIAIGSIFPPDKDTHLEAVRYGSGSGFWKLLGVPLTHGKSMAGRILKLCWKMLVRPVPWLRVYFSRDFARESMILLFMQHLDSTLGIRRGLFNLRSNISNGAPPSAFISFSKELAEAASREVAGTPFVLATEVMTGTPTTAHILGGCVIGRDAREGVIDLDHRVFGYENLFVCDGSAISSNPGVNPSLTIAAMTERAMSKIPDKK